MSTIHCNHPNDTLSIEEWEQIETRMYPNGKSLSGFLQPNEKLSTIIQKDLEYLKSIDITTKQISDRLLTITSKYTQQRYLNYIDNIESYNIIVENKFSITSTVYNGAQICPFKNTTVDNNYHGFSYGDSDIIITNNNTGESITFNTLLIHMINQHHFFEGSVRHRLEPADVVRVLEIKPGIDYEPEFKTEYFWNVIYATTRSELYNDKTLEILQHYSCDYEIIKTPEKKIYAYLFPDDIMSISNWFLIDTAYNSKQSYSEMRQMVLNYENNECIDLVKKVIVNISEIKTIEDIEKKINAEERLITRYKETGNIEDMVMILFTSCKVDNIKLFNTPLKDIFGGQAHYRCSKRKYVDI